MADCATRLTEAKAALHAVQIGESITSVTLHDGRNNTYKPVSIAALKKYVKELDAECGTSESTPQIRRGCINFYG